MGMRLKIVQAAALLGEVQPASAVLKLAEAYLYRGGPDRNRDEAWRHLANLRQAYDTALCDGRYAKRNKPRTATATARPNGGPQR